MMPGRSGWFSTAIAAVLLLYVLRGREWIKTWGATPDELRRSFPGDDLIPAPRYQSLRAITIETTPERIWPWLVQMGQGRGGLYSYDWLENMVGLDFHSADEIVPELQDLTLGDSICLAPEGEMPLAVTILEPDRALVIRTGREGEPQAPGDYLKGEIAASWGFILEPIDEHSTRLIVDWRADWEPALYSDLLNVVMLEPVHFIMERAMILGIKRRAEEYAGVSPTSEPAAAEPARDTA
jgi:hypothetical protein